MRYRLTYFFFLLSILWGGNACKDDQLPVPDNILQFSTGTVKFTESQDEVAVTLNFTRALESAAEIIIQMEPSGITYDEGFTTEPAADNNTITLKFPAESNKGTFKIIKKPGIFLSGTETIKLSLKSLPAPLLTGEISSATVSFTPVISAGSELTLNGIYGTEPGSSALNSVYVDFSHNSAFPVRRLAWDFGFYCGADFLVILNNTTGATARMLDKNDQEAVVAADTVPASAWALTGTQPAEMALIDDVSGDLSKTVIQEISATNADNKVYIINRGISGSIPERPWLKVRILRKGSTGYTLQYAGINETNFKTIDITKDARYNFIYLAVNGQNAGRVTVEPPKSDWDVKWGYQITQTAPSSGVMVPYPTSDFVAINRLAGVEAAEIMTSAVTYEAFDEADLASVEFTSDYDVIGTNWRTISATAGGSAVKKDRFYVVKDPAGNIYKIRFLSFHPDEGGTLGKPKLEYQIVKKQS